MIGNAIRKLPEHVIFKTDMSVSLTCIIRNEFFSSEGRYVPRGRMEMNGEIIKNTATMSVSFHYFRR